MPGDSKDWNDSSLTLISSCKCDTRVQVGAAMLPRSDPSRALDAESPVGGRLAGGGISYCHLGTEQLQTLEVLALECPSETI